MSISTKKGDKGQTSLWSGERVWKDDIRVESYGTIDELNSHIGESKHYVKSHEIKEILIDIQNDLFRVAGQLASKDKLYVKPIEESDVEKITQYVYKYETRLNLKGFVIPGNTIQSSKLDVCRTIARRAERRIISLSKVSQVPEQLNKYVNRLSDLLFIIARFEEHLEDKLEYKKW
ncbi:cob(I)yrinic acid a,c-diamide adenosyltransferase [Oceanotoga sp. DSM 15011]|jgi:ATP:cob(I)alamin adenosyltransferase|uniref:Corrinoid adenosyltransferase n=1 Tax=Oceanotoga teriensis TaxID=515440 RepID=A0AA45C9F3_9BACT|nr:MULTISPECIES: cob(I)yrinic acid a,c-diamide adenosyltransferase [Oceanotoga]MDO7975382.1 cob(I)yrinic acid a,c-diamide adenosyltransferase [Oceanotoga teriensis]PWJ96714.1 ATP:cob(I)alamin adenosyltransferase [Oceanotoga teriensis]UYP00114.1 cob(I)yrinic acid a,c-diamide adenosyltransferase [Oceanotoga sp. DSM 15011]